MTAATEPQTSQALVEVQRSLPVPQTRFDEFLLKAHALAEKAVVDRDEALAYEVDSEPAFQIADTRMAALKANAKTIGEERVDLTRTIDDFKKVFIDAEKGATDPLNEGARTYAAKMLAYRMEKQRKAQEAQREAERLLQEQKQKELERARKLEERAAQLKTESAKDRLYSEAERIKEAVTIMPETIATPVAEPQTVASDVRDNWKSEPKQGRMRDALLWLADHAEWWDMIQFTASGSKRLAKQYHNVQDKAEPFRIWNEQGFASKRR